MHPLALLADRAHVVDLLLETLCDALLMHEEAKPLWVRKGGSEACLTW
jgi:hypothetical protein